MISQAKLGSIAAALTAATQATSGQLAPPVATVASFYLAADTGGFVGTVSFQVSNDGGRWSPIAAYPLGANGALGAPVSSTTTGGVFAVPLHGWAFVRAIVSAYTSGAMNASYSDSASGSPTQVFANTEGTRPTFGSSFGAFTPAATATDIAQLIGSASKVVRLTRVAITGLATAAAAVDLALIKRTAANTGGTVAAQTIVPYDSSNPAPTAVFNTYSVNAAGLGASAGAVKTQKLALGASPAVGAQLVWDFASRGESALVLRGVAEGLSLSWGGVAVPAGTLLDCEITWIEE